VKSPLPRGSVVRLAYNLAGADHFEIGLAQMARIGVPGYALVFLHEGIAKFWLHFQFSRFSSICS